MPLQYPLLFRFAPADLDFGQRARETIRVEARIGAKPEEVFAHVIRLQRAKEWLRYFKHVRWRTAQHEGVGATADETFAFMTLRIRTLTEQVGEHWVSSVDACSMPLASMMLQDIRLEADGDAARLCWSIHYDPPLLLRPVDPLLQPFFRHMFSSSVARLKKLLEP